MEENITGQQLRQVAAVEQLEFEQLISALSAMLISLPHQEIDRKIEDGLRLIGEFMEVDRCFIDQFSEDQNEFRVTHMWTADGIPYDDFAFSVVLSDYLPWYTKKILNGEPFIFSTKFKLQDQDWREQMMKKR